MKMTLSWWLAFRYLVSKIDFHLVVILTEIVLLCT